MNLDQFIVSFIEYNKPKFEDNFFFDPKGPPGFFAREKGVVKVALIFTNFFLLVSIHINLKFPDR